MNFAIARYCAERSVPVAEPAVDIPSRVYGTARLPMTFWCQILWTRRA